MDETSDLGATGEPEPTGDADETTVLDTTVDDDSGDVIEEDADGTEGEAPRPGVSRTVLVVSVLAALVIAGIAGMAIGWKVEQQRVKDDLANIRPIGTVTAVEDGSVTVQLSTASGTRTYAITDTTVIGGAEGADAADLDAGAKVLVKSTRSSDGELEAAEIVILPEDTTFGS